MQFWLSSLIDWHGNICKVCYPMVRPIGPQRFSHPSRSCGRCRGWPGRSGSPIWTWGSESCESVQSKRARRWWRCSPPPGKTAYCRRVTPQLGSDEVRQKVSQVKGGSYAGRGRGGIGYQRADPKTTHFPNFPTHPPTTCLPHFPPALKAPFSPDTPSLSCAVRQSDIYVKGPFLLACKNTYLRTSLRMLCDRLRCFKCFVPIRIWGRLSWMETRVTAADCKTKTKLLQLKMVEKLNEKLSGWKDAAFANFALLPNSSNWHLATLTNKTPIHSKQGQCQNKIFESVGM